MIGQLHHRGWHHALLIALGLAIFFLNLGGASLWDLDEGRNATCAFEMLENGNWIVPSFNAKLRVDKPILLYWLQMSSYLGFGVNEFSARLPSALAALFTVLLCYELTRSMFSRTTGLLAAVIVATMPMLCGAGRFANPDALLNCCTVLTLALFWLGRNERRGWWFPALGAASGLAVLAKGPVGLVLPASVIFLFLLWERQLSIYADRRWLWTTLSFTLTALPWYLWVGVETKGEFLLGFLWTHNVDRALTPMENHHGFPGYYLAVLLAGTAPWSIFLGVSWWYGFWSAIRAPWNRYRTWWTHAAEGMLDGKQLRQDVAPSYRFLVCWIFVYCLFFSLARTKLPNYVLPVIAPCAILIARFLQRWQTGRLLVPAWLTRGGLIGLLVVGAGILFGTALAGGMLEGSLLRGRFIYGLQTWMWIGLLPLFAAAAGWWFLRQRQYRLYVLTVAVMAATILGPFAAYGSLIFDRHKAPRALVAQAHALNRGEDLRIAGWQMEYLPSLNFYVRRNVEHLAEESELANFLRSPVPGFLFMPLEEWQRLEPSLHGLGRLAGKHHDMYHYQEIVVVTNR